MNNPSKKERSNNTSVFTLYVLLFLLFLYFIMSVGTCKHTPYFADIFFVHIYGKSRCGPANLWKYVPFYLSKEFEIIFPELKMCAHKRIHMECKLK